jgi:hypothetical protein
MIKRLLVMVMLLWLPLALLPQPVAAQDDWFTYPCPSGTLDLTSASFEVVAPNVIRVELPGTLACAAGPKYSFAVATFQPGSSVAHVYPGMLAAYDPVGPGTAFTATVAVSKQQQLGVCLMPDPQTRLACVLVTADSSGGVLLSNLDRSRAAVIAEIVPYTPQPECNACWNIR